MALYSNNAELINITYNQTPKGWLSNSGSRKLGHAVCPSVCPSDANRLLDYKRSMAKLNILWKSMTRGWF